MHRKESKIILSDGLYRMGHPRAIPTMLSIAAFVIFYIGSVIEYQELKNQVYILTLALKMKYNLVDVPLITENKRKFLIRMNFVTKCLLYQIFNSLTLLCFIMHILATFLLLYLNGLTCVGLVAAVFWNILSLFWFINFFSIFTLGLFCWYFFTLYLRYAFVGVHNRIINGFRWGN